MPPAAPTAAPGPGPAAMAPTGAPLAAAPQVAPAPANPIQGVQGPQGSAITNPNLGAVANFYGIPKDTGMQVATAKTQGNIASQAYERQMAQVQLQDENVKAKLDPSRYHLEQTAQGVRVIDPTGQQVDAGEFSSRTGSQGIDMLVKAFAQSSNPKEQQFASDYNNFESYMQNAVAAKFDAKGNPQNEAAAITADFWNTPGNEGLKNMTPQQAAQMFISQYGGFMGLSGGTGQLKSATMSGNWSPTYTPQVGSYLYEKGAVAQPPPWSQPSPNQISGGSNNPFGTNLGLLSPNQPRP